MTSQRVVLGKTSNDLQQIVINLDQKASALMGAVGFKEGFSHLLKLRASQINGCAYCVRMHTRDALRTGEPNDRIAVIAAWHESEYFDPKERAALSLVESITRITEGQIPDAVYDAAAAALSSEEIAAVEWIGVVINAWNRIAIAGRLPVKP